MVRLREEAYGNMITLLVIDVKSYPGAGDYRNILAFKIHKGVLGYDVILENSVHDGNMRSVKLMSRWSNMHQSQLSSVLLHQSALRQNPPRRILSDVR